MSQLIQHLNIIVDPAGSFLLTAQDPFDTGTNPVAIADPSTNNAAGGSSDPGNPLVRNPGREIRPGGSGVQPNRHIGAGHSPPPPPPPPPPGPVRFVQDVQTPGPADPNNASANDSITFTGNVTRGNLILLTVQYVGDGSVGGGGGQLPGVSSLADSFGTVYFLAGQVVASNPPDGGDPLVVWLYYGIAAATGFCTISYTIANSIPGLGSRQLVACEYSGVSRSGPLAHVAMDSGAFTMTGNFSLTPGPVVTEGTGSLIFLSTFYVTRPNTPTTSASQTGSPSPPPNAHLRGVFPGQPPPAVLAFTADFFPCPRAALGITPSLNVDCNGDPTSLSTTWAAIAASFNKALP